MHRPLQVLPHRCGRRKVWPLVIAVSVGVLLTGCASPLPRPPGQSLQSLPRQAAPVDVVSSQARAWRIAQTRTEGVPAFRLVANEPLPTRKTLASGERPIAPRAMGAPETAVPSPSASRVDAPSSAPRAARQTRVREPVGTVYFTSAGTQVSAAALRTVAAAAARAGRADRLVLTAYTDPYGSAELNRRLAALRAESVGAVLSAHGIDPAQVIVLSRPQCCAAQPLPEREAAPYRRVDIEILTHRAVLSEEQSHGPQPRS